MTHQHFDDLTHSIYEGLLEKTPWQSFLPTLLKVVDAKAVSLVLRAPADDDQGLILNCVRPHGADTEAQTIELADPDDWPSMAYKERFFTLDPFVNLPEGQVISMHELVPDAELKRSDYYLKYLKPAGVFHILGADATTRDGTQVRLRISRGEEEKPFSLRDKALCQSLIPHLRRAIHLHARLNRIESERNLFANAMDKMAVGSILLNEHGRFMHANGIAETLLDSSNGLIIENGELKATDKCVNKILQQLIYEALETARSKGQPGLVKALSIPRKDKADLGIVIRPVPTSDWAEGQSAPSLAIFISAREWQSNTSIRTLMELFSLTQAEASLALELASGLSIAEASNSLCVSQHTARAHLKSIFAKCQVTRQAELIRLIIKSVATLA